MPQRLHANCKLKTAKRNATRASTHRRGRAQAAVCAAALWLVAAGLAVGQEEIMPGLEPTGADYGAAPVTDFGGVSFYSQDLGTILRLRYNTESYGQDQHGNFDVGTMQVLTFEDWIAFVDGQVTMNDVQGVGFNVGGGVRWLSEYPFGWNMQRIDGVSLWADGTHTEAGNFYPQLGISYESLGELWDVRLNGYVPLGPQDKIGQFKPTGGAPTFLGNSIVEPTEAVVDSSFYTAELEVARRLGRERDAWAFAGPYFLANNDDDSVGYRAGLRGYAYPDLLLQIAVSNDEIFDTHASFTVVWFVGRTRTNYQPACGVPDRFREPVMRNDYVVLAQSKTAGGIPLTQPDGTDLRVVHVDGSAAPGGDGTYENPYDMLSDINDDGSRKGDIILAHAESEFNGDMTTNLKDDQRLLGEGDGFEPTVDTEQLGTIVIPETSPGARNADRPMILAAMGDAIELADANEVANFDFDGQGVTTRAIASPTAGSGNPNLHDLTISNTVGDAIALTPLEVTDTDDRDNDGNTTEKFVLGDVTIDEVMFDNIGGDDIDINSDTPLDVTSSNVTLQETISITNVETTDGDGRGIDIRNTHSTGTVTLSDYTYDGGTTSDGAIRLTNFDSTFNASSSTLTGGAGGGQGVQVQGETAGSITFESSVAFNNLDGTAFDIDGDSAGDNEFTGTVVVNGDIDNDTGLSVSLQGMGGGSATFNGNIDDTGDGIRANSSGGGLALFTGDLTLTTENSTAVALTDNTDTDLDFTGELDITTTGGDGFVATGGGNLTVSNTGNSITTESGQVARITDMTIDNLGANFADINRTTAVATSAVELSDNTDGPITLGTPGDDAGESGTLAGNTTANGHAIVIDNSDNVTVSGLVINDPSTDSGGVLVNRTTTGTQTVNLNNLEINEGNVGVEATGNGTGTLNMTVNDSTINDPTEFGLSVDNIDSGTTQVNNTTIDGDPTNAGAIGVRIKDSNADFTFDVDPGADDTLIQNFAGTDFEVDGGSGSVSFAGQIVNATATNATDTTGRSVHVHDITGGSVTFTPDSEITDDNQGVIVRNNTGGSVSFLGDSGNYDFDTGGNSALTVTGNTNGNYLFSNFDINTTSGNGTDISANTGGTYNFNTFDVTTTSGIAARANANTDGTYNFDAFDLTTSTGAGVDIAANNAAAAFDFNGLDIMATGATGRGFSATGGGTLTVRGTDNTIAITSAANGGVALNVQDMTVGANSVQFESIDVTSGATNAIFLEDLTGSGLVLLGNPAGAANSGGSLTTTGDAIVIRNVQNAQLNNIQIVSSGARGLLIEHTGAATTTMDVTIDSLNLDAAAGNGVEVNTANNTNDFVLQFVNGDLEENFVANATGSALFQMQIEGTTIDDSGTDAFAATLSGSTTNADLILRDVDFNVTAGDFSAVYIDASGGTAKSVDLLIEDSFFDSGGATSATADIISQDSSTMFATIQGNTFDNSGGDDFHITADGAAARMRLNLGGDVSTDENTAAGGGEFDLFQLGGSDFDVFERDDTFAGNRNNGTVDGNGGTYGDLPVAPTPPVIP